MGLAVSGGGFRATLFHLGAFWRLNEIGYLKKIERVCSVSGGSTAAAMLGVKWKRLDFDEAGISRNFRAEVAAPLQAFCAEDVDVPAVLGGWLSLIKSPADIITRRYDRLYRGAALTDLPRDDEGPRFIIYATNLQTGVSFRFSRPYMGDYRIGRVDNPDVSLALAVAASSAFPPVLTPVTLDGRKRAWRDWDEPGLADPAPYRQTVYLSDGGVYDNLGLEAVWDRFETVLVSDAGAPLVSDSKTPLLKFSQVKKTLRVLDITVNQARALRKRRLIDDFRRQVRKGAYWGIATEIEGYGLADAMVKDNAVTASLQKVRTRLNPFSDKEQGQLINWGYALCDAAVRRHVQGGLPAPASFPCPAAPIG